MQNKPNGFKPEWKIPYILLLSIASRPCKVWVVCKNIIYKGLPQYGQYEKEGFTDLPQPAQLFLWRVVEVVTSWPRSSNTPPHASQERNECPLEMGIRGIKNRLM
jgi:hypothetical protein